MQVVHNKQRKQVEASYIYKTALIRYLNRNKANHINNEFLFGFRRPKQIKETKQ